MKSTSLYSSRNDEKPFIFTGVGMGGFGPISFIFIYILRLAKPPYIMVNYIKSIYFRKSVVKSPSVFLNHFRNLCFSITFIKVESRRV